MAVLLARNSASYGSGWGSLPCRRKKLTNSVASVQPGETRRIQRESGAFISNRGPVADFYRPTRAQFHRVLAGDDIERVTLVAVLGQNAHYHHVMLASRRPELHTVAFNYAVFYPEG